MMFNKAFSKIAVAGALLLASAGIAAAQTAFVAVDSLNLRTGPGIRYASVTALPGGARVNVLDCGNGWCYVSTPAGRGYVSESYLSFSGPVYAAAPPVYVAPPVVFSPRPYWRSHWRDRHRHWRGDRHSRRGDRHRGRRH